MQVCAHPDCESTKVRKGRKYCSRKCSASHRSMVARANRPRKNCEWCGQEFEVWPHLVDKQRFCSRDCKRKNDIKVLSKQRGTDHPLYTNNIVHCDNCGKEFHRPPSLIRGEHIFCSIDCRSDFGRVSLVCEQCGDKFEAQKYHADNGARFCSRECYAEWLSHNNVGDAHPNWKGGWEPYYGADWHRQRELCRKRDELTCRLCGATINDVGSENLDVHHIVPYRVSQDNSLNNLVLLCDPCHHQVEAGNIICPTN